jgi:hypothetical protein
MSTITITDDMLGGSWEVTTSVARAIFILLTALESDKQFPMLEPEISVTRRAPHE